ncbi:porin [Shewanella surugensis]|uniref:Porin n=1 Tax=Shewanella surugensis TaxID=212020 RepID=A0ABT0LA85_9GAMM|nr:porin [Shewanella surugensis]MCL1124573.1 porin [Shewanella surugensis]
MNRSIYTILCCFLYCFTPYKVQANNTQFSGEINSSISNSNTPYATLSEKSNSSLENWIYIEIKGKDEISSKLNVLYKMSSLVYNASLDGNDNPTGAYNTYLGLESAYGTLLIGRNDTVFKFSEGDIDLFNSTNADIGNLAAGQTISADAIWYYSPKIADLISLNSTYLMTRNQADTPSESTGSQYALTAVVGDKNLLNQQFYFASAYNKGIDMINAYRQVAQIKLGNVILGGLYQHTKSIKLNEKNMKGNTYFINLKYNLNRINFKVEYGKDTSGLGWYFTNATGGSGSTIDRSHYSDISIEQITIGADYMLSASTRLYTHAIMFQGDYSNSGINTSLENDKVLTIGIDYNF